MNNIDTPMKMLQFLRINNVYDNKEIAIEALTNIGKSPIGNRLEDGTPLLARFHSDGKIKTIMGIVFKGDNETSITVVEGREEIYALLNDLYNITSDLNSQTEDIRNDIEGLKNKDTDLQEQIDDLKNKDVVVEADEDNDYVNVTKSVDGSITTYTITESHELDMGTW